MVGLVLLAAAIVLFVMYKTSSPGTTNAAAVIDGISCDTAEHTRATDHHYHAHLTILYQGTEVTIPGSIGIPTSPGNCIYWLHTHDETGLIHVEAPADKDKGFTLGQFFDVWGKKLSSTQVADFKAGANQQIKVWVDGQPYTANPRDIVLKAHEQIVIEVGPPFTDPPPTYTFPADT